MEQHKAGFVNIIGRPNVGKSTLMNALVGERLSIITSKAQTTRHRILGIVNGDDFQMILSDTPGIVLNPATELHKSMMSFVSSSFEDADILLFMTDVFETEEAQAEALAKVAKLEGVPKFLLLNKVDLQTDGQIVEHLKYWESKKIFDEIVPLSALKGYNVDHLLDMLLKGLPNHPPYFDKESLTDKPERFFVDEIVREKIFKNYKQEIPYATQVITDVFQEEDDIIRIRAEIFVEKESQKNIIIGKAGFAIKEVGIAARKDMEVFFGKKIYLELFVKVKDKWRNNPNLLKSFGYNK